MPSRTAAAYRFPKELRLQSYCFAKQRVIAAGYSREIDWQDSLRFHEVSETDFLRETAWVILACGMRESVVRARFPAITEAFLFWETARSIVYDLESCTSRALHVFAHGGKIRAIGLVAQKVAELGFWTVKGTIALQGLAFLRTLPFIGEITQFHLAKNLGLEEVKPDRHLVRFAHAFGYASPRALCEDIATHTGDRITVVDLVLWRFATIETQAVSLLQAASQPV